MAPDESRARVLPERVRDEIAGERSQAAARARRRLANGVTGRPSRLTSSASIRISRPTFTAANSPREMSRRTVSAEHRKASATSLMVRNWGTSWLHISLHAQRGARMGFSIGPGAQGQLSGVRNAQAIAPAASGGVRLGRTTTLPLQFCHHFRGVRARRSVQPHWLPARVRRRRARSRTRDLPHGDADPTQRGHVGARRVRRLPIAAVQRGPEGAVTLSISRSRAPR